MGLEKFGSTEEEVDEKCEIVTPDGIDWTACKCDISEVHRFSEPVNEIDLIGHLREEHGYEFEDAKQRVKKYKAISESMRNNWENITQ